MAFFSLKSPSKMEFFTINALCNGPYRSKVLGNGLEEAEEEGGDEDQERTPSSGQARSRLASFSSS
jgi:hypothetical protein